MEQVEQRKAWIDLVGDSEGFEGDTVEDKRLLKTLVGKTSFGWEEYETLAQEANKHDYGLGIIILSSSKRHRHHQLRRKAA
ncbi:hypothetical protein ES703_11737 [subsurface metagenome]